MIKNTKSAKLIKVIFKKLHICYNVVPAAEKNSDLDY